MNRRERFIDVVRNGSEGAYASLQIGAGAGFDAKLAGKKWNSEATIEDIVAAYEIVGCDPLINLGLPGFGDFVGELKQVSKVDSSEGKRVTDSRLDTPYGTLNWKFHEMPKNGVTPLAYPISIEDGGKAFDIVCWYAEQQLKGVRYIDELLGPVLEKSLPFGAVCIQWNLQPFELFGLTSVDNVVLLAMTEPGRFRKTCDLIRDVNIELVRKVITAGADFVFLGGPGAEMMSPGLYEEYIVPDSKAITDVVHEVGGLVYSHICSPIEPFLSKGYYNQMGIDLFETLSPPPVGNVADLKAARAMLDPAMCTRGNIGLDVLLNGTAEDVEKATLEIIEATAGSKHMVAASDYLFYDIPLGNVKAMVKAVENSK